MTGRIRQTILERRFNRRLRSFVQTFDSEDHPGSRFPACPGSACPRHHRRDPSPPDRKQPRLTLRRRRRAARAGGRLHHLHFLADHGAPASGEAGRGGAVRGTRGACKSPWPLARRDRPGLRQTSRQLSSGLQLHWLHRKLLLPDAFPPRRAPGRGRRKAKGVMRGDCGSSWPRPLLFPLQTTHLDEDLLHVLMVAVDPVFHPPACSYDVVSRQRSGEFELEVQGNAGSRRMIIAGELLPAPPGVPQSLSSHPLRTLGPAFFPPSNGTAPLAGVMRVPNRRAYT